MKRSIKISLYFYILSVVVATIVSYFVFDNLQRFPEPQLIKITRPIEHYTISIGTIVIGLSVGLSLIFLFIGALKKRKDPSLDVL